MINVFDKFGNEMTSVLYTKQTEHYLEKISVGLFSNTSYYIIDETLGRNLTIEATLKTSSNLFSFFSVSQLTQAITLTQAKTITLAKTVTASANVYQVDVLWSADKFMLDEAELIIVIKDGATEIGSFTSKLYAESVEIETRLTTLLSANRKINIDEAWALSFRQSDIDEANVDAELLNTKRLEFLREYDDIQAYIGAYRGLISALKFFGYDDDVILEEHWEWFDESLGITHTKTHNIEKQYTEKKIQELSNFIRTNKFSLLYNINDYTHNVQTTNTSVTEIVNVFSNAQAAFIKISNMKKLLETHLLPAHVVITEVVAIQHHMQPIREFNTMHKAEIIYSNTNNSLNNINYDFVVEETIRSRTYLSYEEITLASQLQENDVAQICARTQKSQLDLYSTRFQNVDASQFLMLNNNDVETLQKWFVRHSTALILFQIHDNFNDVSANTQKFKCVVIDTDTDTNVYEVEHYHPTIVANDAIPQFIQLSIDKAGSYEVIVSYTDFNNVEHVYNKSFTAKMYELSIDMFRHDRPYEPQKLETTEWSSFQKMRKTLYQTEAIIKEPQLNEIDLFNSEKTHDVNGLPVFETKPLQTYDFNQWPNIVATTLYKTTELQELFLNTPTIYQQRNLRIDDKNIQISRFNASYAFMYFDIVGTGTQKTFDLVLKYKNTEILGSTPIAYAGHVNDDSDYNYLTSVASTINESNNEVFSNFTWSVKLMRFAIGVGQFEERYVLIALSKVVDSIIRYEVDALTSQQISVHAYRHISYSETKAYVLAKSVDFTSNTALEVTIDDSTTLHSLQITTLQQLKHFLDFNHADELDVYEAKVDLNTNQPLELLIVAKTAKSITIKHQNIGTLSNVYREPSVERFIKVRQGSDFSIHEPVIISVNHTFSYKPYSINWQVINSNGDTILTSNDTVLKLWTNLSKHQFKDEYTIVATWQDKYGTQYTDTFNSLIIIKRNLVDAKYETFDRDGRFKFVSKADKNMWRIESKAPLWYLPTVIHNITFVQQLQQGGVWILSTGFWLDTGIWIDTSYWND